MFLNVFTLLFHGLMKNIFVFSPMGIVTIGTIHSLQVLVHFILKYAFSPVTMKAQLLPGKPE